MEMSSEDVRMGYIYRSRFPQPHCRQSFPASISRQSRPPMVLSCSNPQAFRLPPALPLVSPRPLSREADFPAPQEAQSTNGNSSPRSIWLSRQGIKPRHPTWPQHQSHQPSHQNRQSQNHSLEHKPPSQIRHSFRSKWRQLLLPFHELSSCR